MKQLIILLSVVIFSGINLLAQEMDTIPAPQTDSTIIAGELQRMEIQTGDFGDIFMEGYRKYIVDNDQLSAIENYIYQYSITIVLGTWCHDSKEQVPRFYKILDKLDYNTENVGLIGVDRSKLADDIDLTLLNIEKVPTFIFYLNGVEKGRIIETPELTLEKNILNILSK